MKQLLLLLLCIPALGLAHPGVDAFLEADPDPDLTGTEAVSLQAQVLAQSEFSAGERAFVLNVQAAIEGVPNWTKISLPFLEGLAPKDDLIGALAAARGDDPAAWTDGRIAAGFGPVTHFLQKHPDSALASRVVSEFRETGRTGRNWAAVFNSHAATLSIQDQRSLVQAELAHFLALPERTPDQDRRMDNLTRNLMALQVIDTD